MPTIRRARRLDIPRINLLLQTYGLASIDATYINHRDVALVAMEGGECVGFIWAGLMRQNKMAYLDYFTVRKDYSHKGVGQQLARGLWKILNKIGVTKAFGVIERREWHDSSAMNALKMAMMARETSYTYVYGDLAHTARELGLQGA